MHRRTFSGFFLTLRLTFTRKLASKSWIREILIAFLFNYQITLRTYYTTIWTCNGLYNIWGYTGIFHIWISKVQDTFIREHGTRPGAEELYDLFKSCLFLISKLTDSNPSRLSVKNIVRVCLWIEIWNASLIIYDSITN